LTYVREFVHVGPQALRHPGARLFFKESLPLNFKKVPSKTRPPFWIWMGLRVFVFCFLMTTTGVILLGLAAAVLLPAAYAQDCNSRKRQRRMARLDDKSCRNPPGSKEPQ
jgi:hypothetical protein